MTQKELERRVSQLEAELAQLRDEVRGTRGREKDWRRAVEKYAGDEDLVAIIAEARKIREADRAKVARPPRKRRKGTE
jgi:hypothetical protein